MNYSRKYRFKLVNPCDYVDIYNATDIGQFGTTNIIIGTHTILAGDSVYIEGFDRRIEGYYVVDSVDSTTIRLNIPGPLIDVSLLGTVKKVVPYFADPLNFYNSKFEWTKQKGQIFHRKSLSGKLKFTNQNEDWQYFFSKVLPSECCKVLFFIEKKCTGLGIGSEDGGSIDTEQAWNTDWQGYFTRSNGKWDISHCNVELDIEIDDAYACLDSYSSDDVNILPEVEKNSVFIKSDITIEQFECCQDDVNVYGFSYQGEYGNCEDLVLTTFTGSLGAGFWAERTVIGCNGIQTGPTADQAYSIIKTRIIIDAITDGGGNDITLTGRVCTTYIRQTIVTLDSGGEPNQPDANGGNEWYALESFEINGYPVTKWARSPNNCPAGIGGWSAYVIANGLGAFEQTRVGDCEEFIVVYPTCFEEPSTIEYTSGRNFGEVCNYVATKFCGRAIGVRSDFFEINAPGDTPGFTAGVNYITGLINKVKNMLIYQKSDILYPAADQSAAVGELSFDDLEVIWREMFNCYWFIDSDGYIRVEHINWFLRAATVDTTVGYENTKINQSKHIFSFDKSDIPIREEYTWMEQNDFDFIGVPIRYSPFCSNPKNITYHPVAFVTTDVNMILNLPEDINEDGFVLIAVDQDDNTKIDREAGLLTGEVKNNAHLSWANLHYNYHRYERWLSSGEMNGEPTSFLSVKKTKRQVGIMLKTNGCCKAIEPLTDLATTEIGDGVIDKMTKDNRTEVFSFELLFE